LARSTARTRFAGAEGNTKIKELRFVFEHDGNWAALQRLQDELLCELDLFDATKWNLKP
jgi:hypothetical protein